MPACPRCGSTPAPASWSSTSRSASCAASTRSRCSAGRGRCSTRWRRSLIYTIVFSVFLKVEPPTRRPERAQQLRRCSCCAAWSRGTSRPAALTLSLDSLVANAQPDQEGLLPARAARRLDDRRRSSSRLLIELGVLGVILLIVGNMVLPWIPVVLVLVAMLTGMRARHRAWSLRGRATSTSATSSTS